MGQGRPTNPGAVASARWVDSGPTRFCRLHNWYLAMQSRHDDDDDDNVDDSTKRVSIFSSRSLSKCNI